jgi:hypothetical protein
LGGVLQDSTGIGNTPTTAQDDSTYRMVNRAADGRRRTVARNIQGWGCLPLRYMQW